ncbi:MAG: hypothetical protein ACODAF_05515 [Actinomycetota bacterium]
METLEEIRAEVARIYRDHLPARLAGMSPTEQEAMFDRIAESVLDEVDQLAPEMRAAAIREETARLGQHPDYQATVAIGRTARAQAIQQVMDEQVYSLIN